MNIENQRPRRLQDLRGLGPAAELMLKKAGISSPEQLDKLGAVQAYLQVEKTSGKVSLNLLWALEGALSNTDWRDVASRQRGRLLIELDARRSSPH